MNSSQKLINAKCAERVAIIKAVQLERKAAKKRLDANVVVGLASVMPRELGSHIATFLRVPISAAAATKMSGVNKRYGVTGLVEAIQRTWFQHVSITPEEANEFLRRHMERKLVGLTRDEQEDIIRYLTVSELKDLCRGRGLRVSGKKAILVARLLE